MPPSTRSWYLLPFSPLLLLFSIQTPFHKRIMLQNLGRNRTTWSPSYPSDPQDMDPPIKGRTGWYHIDGIIATQNYNHMGSKMINRCQMPTHHTTRAIMLHHGKQRYPGQNGHTPPRDTGNYGIISYTPTYNHSSLLTNFNGTPTHTQVTTPSSLNTTNPPSKVISIAKTQWLVIQKNQRWTQ